MQVSVVLPCLNEAASVEAVIRQTRKALDASGLLGEIIVSDNGSDDGSAALALAAGARVIFASPRGYGAALRAGLEAARGEVVVMADTDMTYPLERIADFVAACETADVAVGFRQTHSSNMPLLNRMIGNPLLSGLARWLSSSTVNDFHCGMRSIRSDAASRLDLRTTGMEFASEMLILALDESKLNRWRDGWRHVTFLVSYAPARKAVLPAAVAAGVAAAGALGYAAARVERGRAQTPLLWAAACAFAVVPVAALHGAARANGLANRVPVQFQELSTDPVAPLPTTNV